MTEIWKPIPGFEGSYEVSDLGRVRSLDRIITSPEAKRGYPKRVRGCLLKPQFHSEGYVQVSLSGRSHLVSWLVLQAFVSSRPGKQEACHGDGNRQNNTLTNLRWGTHVDNCADRLAHGTHPSGERNGGAKLTAADVVRIRTGTESRETLAEAHGVSARHIDRLRRRERWAHV